MNEILEELYAEGRQASPETAGEIIDRLEARKNFIPSSAGTRREYASLLLAEYREYVEAAGLTHRSSSHPTDATPEK